MSIVHKLTKLKQVRPESPNTFKPDNLKKMNYET